MQKFLNLKDIFNDDDQGILDTKSKKSSEKTEDDRLVESFKEINNFYEKNNRAPEYSIDNLNEHKLHSRLQGIIENEDKINKLKNIDIHKILINPNKKPTTISEILDDDDLNVLESESLDIFEIKNVPIKKISQTDFVARRKSCKNFEKYEPIFVQVQNELSSGKRELISFNDSQLSEKTYFIHNGILLFLEKIFDLHKDKFGKNDGRTKIIFENGTESNMKLRSLGKNLLISGKTVTNTDEDISRDFQNTFENILDRDEEAGFIYVLKSNNKNREIAEINNLYKIGFSDNDVQTRISNAKNDPTYLMSSVTIVKIYKCFNLNPQKLEMLLHKFFGNSCLNIDIFDHSGKRHSPREWFIAPLDIIDKVIKLIISGDIIHYQYDNFSEKIVTR